MRYKDKEGEDIDLYDVRRRSWYVNFELFNDRSDMTLLTVTFPRFVQGMSLPKDMLILIDRLVNS